MNLRAFSHIFLAMTVFFTSSFAVIHGSEHIVIEKADSHTHLSSSFSFSDEHHSSHHSESVKRGSGHQLESLCEGCLVLSNLTASASSRLFLGFLPSQANYLLSSQSTQLKSSFLSYLSRAPPRIA